MLCGLCQAKGPAVALRPAVPLCLPERAAASPLDRHLLFRQQWLPPRVGLEQPCAQLQGGPGVGGATWVVMERPETPMEALCGRGACCALRCPLLHDMALTGAASPSTAPYPTRRARRNSLTFPAGSSEGSPASGSSSASQRESGTAGGSTCQATAGPRLSMPDLLCSQGGSSGRAWESGCRAHLARGTGAPRAGHPRAASPTCTASFERLRTEPNARPRMAVSMRSSASAPYLGGGRWRAGGQAGG